MPPKISGIVSAKRLLRQRLARIAARKYTYVWNKVIRESKGIREKTNLLPPGFIGTVNNKYKRAQLYENRMINYALAHPKHYARLYRGITGWEANQFETKKTVVKTTMSSFSKDINVAVNFGEEVFSRNILVLDSNIEKIPAINFTSGGNFQSEYAPGGKFIHKNEQEVLLPPGTFRVQESYFNPYYNATFYIVTFKPKIKNTSYLHRYSPKKIHVGSRDKKIHVGSRGGKYVLSPKGKKMYLKKVVV